MFVLAMVEPSHFYSFYFKGMAFRGSDGDRGCLKDEYELYQSPCLCLGLFLENHYYNEKMRTETPFPIINNHNV
jgi:hypothetical protein